MSMRIAASACQVLQVFSGPRGARMLPWVRWERACSSDFPVLGADEAVGMSILRRFSGPESRETRGRAIVAIRGRRCGMDRGGRHERAASSASLAECAAAREDAVSRAEGAREKGPIMARKKKTTKKKSAGKKKTSKKVAKKKKTASRKKTAKKSAGRKKTAKKTARKSTAKKKSKKKSKKKTAKRAKSAAPAKAKQSDSPEAVSGRAFAWHEVYSRSPEQTKHFYATILGWTTSEMDMGGGMKYTMFHHHGVPIAGMMPMHGPEWEGVPPHWMTYLRVPNCDEATEKAMLLGATVKVPPTDIPGNIGRFSIIMDPAGAGIALYHSAQ